MKLQAAEHTVHTNIETTPTQFAIANDPVAFDILSNQLYTNKIKAVIREICCNAKDAHTKAGTQDTPFRVHLPTHIEPFFSVRDYGTGLSNLAMTTLMTTYFGSDKRLTNELIGGLGLGSKSPMAYTNSFTVISYFQGIRYTYSCFKGQDLRPNCLLISEKPTDEDNGVEVIVPVETKDVYKFEHEAMNVLPFIGNHTSNKNFTQLNWVVPMTEEGWGILHYSAGFSNINILQGNVIYAVTCSDLSNHPRFTATDSGLYRRGNLVIQVPIGTLAVAASREHLSLDPVTFQRLGDIVADTYQKFHNWLVQEINKQPTIIEATQLAIKVINNGGFNHYPTLRFKDGRIIDLSQSIFGIPFSPVIQDAIKEKQLQVYQYTRHKGRFTKAEVAKRFNLYMTKPQEFFFTVNGTLEDFKETANSVASSVESVYFIKAKSTDLLPDVEANLEGLTITVEDYTKVVNRTVKVSQYNGPVKCKKMHSYITNTWEDYETRPDLSYYYMDLYGGKIQTTHSSELDKLLNRESHIDRAPLLPQLITHFHDWIDRPILGFPASMAKKRRPDPKQLAEFGPFFYDLLLGLYQEYNPMYEVFTNFHSDVLGCFQRHLSKEDFDATKPLLQYWEKLEAHQKEHTKHFRLFTLFKSNASFLLGWPNKEYKAPKTKWVKEFETLCTQYPALNFLKDDYHTQTKISLNRIHSTTFNETLKTFLIQHDKEV